MERVKILLFLSCAAVVLTSVAGQCPRIITRASWGARSANTAILPVRPAPLAIIHHTAGAACSTQAACSQQMRNIQSLHIDVNRWADIGYNFCVGGDGQVYEGRGWNRQGAHASGFNDRSVGICFIGTFTNSLPTAAARSAARALITCGVSLGNIRSDHSLVGHRQANPTQCPGNALFNEIRNWPRFNPNF